MRNEGQWLCVFTAVSSGGVKQQGAGPPHPRALLNSSLNGHSNWGLDIWSCKKEGGAEGEHPVGLKNSFSWLW